MNFCFLQQIPCILCRSLCLVVLIMLVAIQGWAGCSVWLDKLQKCCASLPLFDSLYQKCLMLRFYFVYYFIVHFYSATSDTSHWNCSLSPSFLHSEQYLKDSFGCLPFVIPFLFLPQFNFWHSLHSIMRVIIWVKSQCLNILFELVAIGKNCVVADIFTMNSASLTSPLAFLIFSACGLWIMFSELGFCSRQNKDILPLTAFQKWEMLLKKFCLEGVYGMEWSAHQLWHMFCGTCHYLLHVLN